MKVGKYIKDKQNKYKVFIDEEEYILYDDIIIKYELLVHKDISLNTFKEMLKENSELDGYYLSIKYINKKLRSEKEIREYLKKKEFDINIINKTIKRLKDNKFINDEIYLKAFINDEINLTNNGPKKIEKRLLNFGLNEDDIKLKIDMIDDDIWYNKIDKYINKKIISNHNVSSNNLKMKIINDLINLGYEKEMIINILDKKEINDEDILKKEYLKIKNSLSKKYEGYELNQKIKEKLYRKGFRINNLEELDEE